MHSQVSSLFVRERLLIALAASSLLYSAFLLVAEAQFAPQVTPSPSPRRDGPLVSDNQFRPNPDQGRTSGPFGSPQNLPLQPFFSDFNDQLRKDALYFVVASKMVRPGQVYKVAVNILESQNPVLVRASIQRDGVELGSDVKSCNEHTPEILMIKVPFTSTPGNYKLRVEGNLNSVLGGTIFLNETSLQFSQRFMTMLIQTDRPIYRQGQSIRFRIVPINTELKAFDDPVEVYMLDPNGIIVRRWLSRQTNLGAVSLEYMLAEQVTTGTWIIRVEAQGQIEEQPIIVDEYFQTRFEVNVSMPSFFMETDQYIHGRVEANYTSGAPVLGNLTLRATVKPYRGSYRQPSGGVPMIEKQVAVFRGTHDFRFHKSEFQRFVNKMEDMEVKVEALVGEPFLDEVTLGFASALVFNSSIKMTFLGQQPQVFKPTTPIRVYLAVSYYDNSPLPSYKYSVDIFPVLIFNRGGPPLRLEQRQARPLVGSQLGLFELEIDLLSERSLDKSRLRDLAQIKLDARYGEFQDEARCSLLLLSQWSPSNHHLSVMTSTRNAKVGEYIIFHVRSDFFITEFSYVILAKGIILHGGVESIKSSLRTFAVPLSPEMAPTATIVIYHLSRDGEVVADSLTFPCNGISRNKFNVTLNSRKEKRGDFIEVVVRGEPGAYVGLSAMDHDMYTMQAGNELSHSSVLIDMGGFDEGFINGTFTHIWRDRNGHPDRISYFPSSSYGNDANKTFAYAGLVVFTDAYVPKRPTKFNCDNELGWLPCLSGEPAASCYRVDHLCDGLRHCEDGSDELNCPARDVFNYAEWKRNRRNRFLRLYDNTWLWKDINVGPHGHFIFNISVPERPAFWDINAFSLSKTRGFGLIPQVIEYAGARPFYMTLEMPFTCTQGEQMGLRITLFNFMSNDMQVIVVLASNRDYKFVHVGEKGIVSSYEPKTTFGEHQHLLWMYHHSVQTVFFPIVPTRLGDINVTVVAKTSIGAYSVTRTVTVEPDGVAQYRHVSVLMDLSNRAHQIKFLDVNLTETPIIPYFKDRYYLFGTNRAWVTVFGDVVGPTFPFLPLNATNILRLPFGSAENNMFNLAYSVYTLKYMRLTSQRNLAIEKKAFQAINQGYARQMSYITQEGAFMAFRWNTQPSVWLTAFCARMFQEANFNEWEFFVYIDPKVITRALSWVLRFQTEYGAFYENIQYPLDRKMTPEYVESRDMPVKFRNISLTAHVLISLLEIKDLTGEVGARAATAKSLALEYLERMLTIINDFKDPYELAIVTYALILAGSPAGEEAFNKLTKKSRDVDGLTYWGREDISPPKIQNENNRPFLQARLPFAYDASNIETTSYALLCYTARQTFKQESIVNWLNWQRLTDGGWASTQDTLVAVKALIDYTFRSRIREVTDLTLYVEASSSPQAERQFRIKGSNMAAMQRYQIPNAWGAVRVLAKGNGMAVVQLSVEYHIDMKRFQTQPPINSFSLNTYAKYMGKNSSTIHVLSCQSWIFTQESPVSGMAVLEVGIPTGYIVYQQDLDKYVKSRRVRNLRRARYEDRKVNFYFEYLDPRDTCIDLFVQRYHPVANMTRFVSVKVYDYYAPERFNETLFDMYNLYVLNICQVCGSYQCPYCPVYSTANAIRISLAMIALLTWAHVRSGWTRRVS